MTTLNVVGSDEEIQNREAGCIASMNAAPLISSASVMQQSEPKATSELREVFSASPLSSRARVLWRDNAARTQAVAIHPIDSGAAISFVGGQLTWMREAFGIKSLSVVSGSGLAQTLSRVDALRYEDEADDYGALRPAAGLVAEIKSAIERAYLTIYEVSSIDPLQPPIVTTDENASVRLTWRHGRRELRVTFVGIQLNASYAYRQAGRQYSVTPLSEEPLESHLRWLVE